MWTCHKVRCKRTNTFMYIDHTEHTEHTKSMWACHTLSRNPVIKEEASDMVTPNISLREPGPEKDTEKERKER